MQLRDVVNPGDNKGVAERQFKGASPKGTRKGSSKAVGPKGAGPNRKA